MCRPGKAGPRLLLTALLCAASIGCFSDSVQTVGKQTAHWWKQVDGFSPELASGLYLQTALVEQPVPDPFLTTELWNDPVLTNPLPAELSALLELNGIRVRVTSGIPPAQLQTMLNSEKSVVDPTHRTLEAGRSKVIPVNGPLERAVIETRREWKADPIKTDWADVECGLAVKAERDDDGRVTLRCEPKVQFGGRQTYLNPTADGSGFSRKEAKPTETYPTLSWEVRLRDNDYLIVGPTEDPELTLGRAFFIADDAPRVRQRVLVIRAAQVADGFATPDRLVGSKASAR